MVGGAEKGQPLRAYFANLLGDPIHKLRFGRWPCLDALEPIRDSRSGTCTMIRPFFRQ